MPLANGFDHSYYLGDQGRFFNPRVHYEDDRKLPSVEPDSGYYATMAIASHAIEHLRGHDQRHREQPFFCYLAFTAPHFPLHALPEDIQRYHTTYDAGWEKMRAERWRRIQQLGLVSGTLSAVEPDVGPPYDFPEALKRLGPGETNRPLPWNDLTSQQRSFQAAKMALHAAMIDRIDREIGRVLEQLRTMGAMENTLILFLSDNGASAEIMVRADGHDPEATPGSAATHLCLGPGWSTCSNTPFRRHKTWVHEGGIATPLIMHWPRGIAARGQLRHSPAHVIDVVPTILELAGSASDPAPEAGSQTETELEIAPPPPPGKSLVDLLAEDRTIAREDLWWLHEGNRALRIGDWKLVSAAAEGDWELYNLAQDRTETTNLAERFPERTRRMAEVWEARRGAFLRDATRDLAPQ
jgi:arylsulfatase